MITNNSSATHF